MINPDMNWVEIQDRIKQCKKCKEEGFYAVRCPDDRIPTSEPRNAKFLFISEAPPLNRRYYFYHENTNDRLRNNLFELLRSDFGYEINTIKDFVAEGFFLLPTVKCPSARNGRNTAPPGKVIKLCAEQHLKREIEYIKPESVCLLGLTALHGFLTLRNGLDIRVQGSMDIGRTLSEAAGKVLEAKILDTNAKFIISYWPTKRHRKFHQISEHIRMLMEEAGL